MKHPVSKIVAIVLLLGAVLGLAAGAAAVSRTRMHAQAVMQRLVPPVEDPTLLVPASADEPMAAYGQ